MTIFKVAVPSPSTANRPLIQGQGALGSEQFRDGPGHATLAGHPCRFAMGEFSGSFGGPVMTLLLAGGIIGLSARRKHPAIRVINVHCLGGDRLSEDWTFIDLPRFPSQQGVDILSRYRDYSRT